MNQNFKNYLESLTPKRRDIAREAVAEYLKGESKDVTKCVSAEKIYSLCRDLALEECEHAEVVLMRKDFGVIKRVKLCVGGLDETHFDIRMIIREACLNNATVIAIVHNHPSGATNPSRFDDELTGRAKKACELMRIHLVDHVIIGNGNYYSYRENGKI